MKRVVCLLLSLILLLGLLPTALAADGEENGEQPKYGEPEGFTVEINGEKRICYMGVGQLINGKYTVLSETTMGWSKNQFGALHVAVGLWWITNLGGNYELTALTPTEVKTVTDQVNNSFELTITPASGQTNRNRKKMIRKPLPPLPGCPASASISCRKSIGASGSSRPAAR